MTIIRDGKEVIFVLKMLAALATIVAGANSSACVVFWLDEPSCPKSLIK